MPRRQVGLALEEGFLARVDAARGDVPRVRFIERALEAVLGGELLAEVAPPGGGRSASPRAPETSEVEREGLANVAEATHLSAAARIAQINGHRFKCPAHGCDFSASSPAARCGVHGRTVVPS